jgi:hypothetical protein
MQMTKTTTMMIMNGISALTKDLASSSSAQDGCTLKQFKLDACKTFS